MEDPCDKMPERPIENWSVLISGQVLTSRTETIEDYLRPRVARLGVVGLAGPFQKGAPARYTEYRDGWVTRDETRAGVHVARPGTVGGNLRLIAAFSRYVRQIVHGARGGRPWDLFIGISCFSAFVGVALKKMGWVRRLVYYSIDYYPTPGGWNFNRVMVWGFRWMDRTCARNADWVWHITGRIAEARARLGGLPADRYAHLEMPLSYRQSLLRRYPVESIERWTVGFVGTLTESQGVQLLIEALPRLAARFPGLKVRIIGRGPYAGELERRVDQSGHRDRVIFHGFIRDEEEMMEIVAHCAVAVAPWTQTADNNILYADPGKPKLYMCLGVPCVITRGPEIAEQVVRAGAGRAIDYSAGELAAAVEDLMGDEERLGQARERAYELGHEFVSEKIIKEAVERSFYFRETRK